MSDVATLRALKAAGDRALAGGEARDTFAAFGLDSETALRWAVAWIQELAADVESVGEDSRTEDFRARAALACLAVGIEHGLTLNRLGGSTDGE